MILSTIVIASLLAAPGDAPVRSARLLPESAQAGPVRPRLWPPVLATVGGAGLALAGLGLIWTGIFVGYWYAFSFATAAVVMLTAGIVVFAVAVPLTVLGGIKLRQTLRARREFDETIQRQEHPPLVTIATF